MVACREAQELLRRVVREHPGTSLALLAQEELQSPFSFRWAETCVESAARETQAAALAKKQKALLDIATQSARHKKQSPASMGGFGVGIGRQRSKVGLSEYRKEASYGSSFAKGFGVDGRRSRA